MEYLNELKTNLNNAWDYNDQKNAYIVILDYIDTLESFYKVEIKSLTIRHQKINNQYDKQVRIFDFGNFELALIKVLSDNYDEATQRGVIAYACETINSDNNQINRETYYKISPFFNCLCHTISRATSGKYHQTKKDAKNGYYFELKEQGIALKVPFRAVFNTNSKLKDIKALNFSDALNCPSHRLGYCQLCDKNLCYAYQGQKRASNTTTNNGFKCMNSYYNSILSIKAIELLKHDAGLYYKFVEYIKANHTIIRFNQIGDFKDETDYNLLINLALDCPDTVFYGYSARDDLLKGYGEGIHALFSPINLFINGSNKQYTNRFQTTTNIKQHLNNPKKCIGDCMNCKKCYTLRGQTISCLLHGSLKNIDKYFNNEANRQFLKEFFNTNFNRLNLSDDDLKTHAGLLESLNEALKNSIYSTWNFKDFKELLAYIKTMGWD